MLAADVEGASNEKAAAGFAVSLLACCEAPNPLVNKEGFATVEDASGDSESISLSSVISVILAG